MGAAPPPTPAVILQGTSTQAFVIMSLTMFCLRNSLFSIHHFHYFRHLSYWYSFSPLLITVIVVIILIFFDHVHALLIINHITLQDQTRRKKAHVLIFVQVLTPQLFLLQGTAAQAAVIMLLPVIFSSGSPCIYSSFSLLSHEQRFFFTLNQL